MFFWSLQVLFEPLVYIVSFYALYVFTKNKDLPFKWKFFGIVLILPVAALLHTKYDLIGIDTATCNAVEGFIAQYYTYVVEGVVVFFIFFLLLIESIKNDNLTRKREIRVFGLGIIVFLIAFSSGNIIGSFTDNWNLAQVGLIGMPIFIGFIAYLIVKFHTFSMKLFGAQVLVLGLVLITGSQFFFVLSFTNRVLTAITLVLVSVFGYVLVRSVQASIRERDKLALTAASLASANSNLEDLGKKLEKQNLQLKEIDQQKTDFLSIASHQLRTPLTVINGYIELIKDGGYGKITAETSKILDNMDSSNGHLLKLVDEFLDITRLDQGRTKYSFKPIDLTEMVDGVVKEQSNRAVQKKLKLIWKEPKTHIKADVDDEKIRHVIYNFVDNAIKYSPKGSIAVTIDKEGDEVYFRVKDSGIGFSKSDEANFFQKFYRGENVKTIDVSGTGLGLYVCRKFIEAHNGKIWAHSPGLGEGSEFGFSIPINKK